MLTTAASWSSCSISTLVEEKRGKALPGLDLPVQEQLEEDDEEKE
jgi:hypothetical protein